MKRIFSLLLVFTTLIGCSNSNELDQLKKENEELKSQLEQFESTTFSEVTSSTNSLVENNLTNNNVVKTDKYEFTKYSWISDYGTSYCAAIVYKNITDKIVNASIDILYKDSDGNIISVDNDELDMLTPNREMVVWSALDTEFADFDVNITLSDPLNTYYSVLEDNILKIDENRVDNKVILTTTNNSDKKVYTDSIVLFFKNNEVVDIETPFIDNIDGIEPSGTTYTEVESDTDFDNYKLYYNGYCETI